MGPRREREPLSLEAQVVGMAPLPRHLCWTSHPLLYPQRSAPA